MLSNRIPTNKHRLKMAVALICKTKLQRNLNQANQKLIENRKYVETCSD